MNKEKRKKEVESFFEEMEKIPGIKELAKAYDRYDELLSITSKYYKVTQPKLRSFVSDKTHES